MFDPPRTIKVEFHDYHENQQSWSQRNHDSHFMNSWIRMHASAIITIQSHDIVWGIHVLGQHVFGNIIYFHEFMILES